MAVSPPCKIPSASYDKWPHIPSEGPGLISCSAPALQVISKPLQHRLCRRQAMAVLALHSCVTSPSRCTLNVKPLIPYPSGSFSYSPAGIPQVTKQFGAWHENKLSALLSLQCRNKGLEGLGTGDGSATVSKYRCNQFKCKTQLKQARF